MRGIKTSLIIIKQVQKLRSKGYSILEISKKVGKSKSIISKYTQKVNILPRYQKILKAKQGGSKWKSSLEWKEAQIKSKNLIKNISQKEKLLILASLYWGEGTKSELNIINSDFNMLKIVVSCLKDLGIVDSEIKATIRIYEDLDFKNVVKFWSKALNLPQECFKNVNILKGKKAGKLKNGMCRIRVEKSSRYFKLIMSLIERIKILLS